MSEARKLFTVDKCCIWPLETGGLILGIIFSLINTVFMFLYLSKITKFWGQPCEKFLADEGIKSAANDFFVDECESVRTFSWIFIIFKLIMYTIDLITMIILIIGIFKRNHFLVIPAIVSEIIELIIFVIRKSFEFNKVAFASIFGIGALSIFWIIILASLYYMFRDEAETIPRYVQSKRGDDGGK